MEASYVPRESEDQLQAPHMVPMVPHGVACSTVAFQSVASSVRLKLEQVDPEGGGGPDRRPWRWSQPLPTSHLLVRLSVWGRPKQRARTRLRSCYFGSSLCLDGCRDLSERAFFVPRLALIGGLRRSYGRERHRSGGLRNLVTYRPSQAQSLSGAREHDLRASVASRGGARGVKDAGTACFVGSGRTAASKA